MSIPWKPPGMCTIIVETLPAVCNSRRSWLRNTVTSPLLSAGSPEHYYVTLYPQTTTNTHTKQVIKKKPFCISCSRPLWTRFRSTALLECDFSQLHYESRCSQYMTRSAAPLYLRSAKLSIYLLIYLYYDCWIFCFCAVSMYSYFIWKDFWLFFGKWNADTGRGWWCPLVSYLQKRCCDEA